MISHISKNIDLILIQLDDIEHKINSLIETITLSNNEIVELNSLVDSFQLKECFYNQFHNKIRTLKSRIRDLMIIKHCAEIDIRNSFQSIRILKLNISFWQAFLFSFICFSDVLKQLVQ